jgi:autotransporter-associated beta strand protein
LVLNASSALKSGTLLNVNAGAYVSLLQGNNAINSLGTITIAAGGTLSADGGASQAHTVNNLIQLNGGNLAGNANYSTTYGQFFLTGGSANITASGSTTSTVSSVIGLCNSLHGLNNITVDSNAVLLVTGKLIGVSGASWGGFNKYGAGTLILTTPSGYAHGMTHYAGTIIFSANALSLHNAAEGSAGYAADFEGNATLQWAAGNTNDLSVSGNLKIGAGVAATLNTGANNITLGTAIVTGGAGAALTKTGTGTLTLAAPEPYTGATTLSNGVIRLAATNTLASTNGVIFAGGVLDMGLYSNVVASSVTVTDAGGTILLGNQTLQFNNSSSNAWTGTLNLTGTLGPQTLRFGTDQSGLTKTQLKQMNSNNRPLMLDNQGYVVLIKGTMILVE